MAEPKCGGFMKIWSVTSRGSSSMNWATRLLRRLSRAKLRRSWWRTVSLDNSHLNWGVWLRYGAGFRESVSSNFDGEGGWFDFPYVPPGPLQVQLHRGWYWGSSILAEGESAEDLPTEFRIPAGATLPVRVVTDDGADPGGCVD